jgi:hypothetical protein
MGPKISPAAAVFAKVLRAFETGGFTCPDVLAEVELLLATGASPTELLEILRRRELVEPLPESAHAQVFDLLNEAKERTAASAALSDETRNVAPETAPERPQDSALATPGSTATASERPQDSAPATPGSTATAASPQGEEEPAQATAVALTSVFKKVVSASESGALTDAEVLVQLQRLLIATGTSPKALLEILRRRKLIEPLPEHTYTELLGLLDDAMARVAVPVAVSDQTRNADPDAAIKQIPDSSSAPIRPTPVAPSVVSPVASPVVSPVAAPVVSPVGSPVVSPVASPVV